MRAAFFLFALCFASCAAPRAVPHYSAPSSAPVRKSLDTVKSHADAARTAIANGDYKLADEQVGELLAQLIKTQDALQLYNEKVEQETNVANAAIDQRNDAVTSAEKAKARYHRLKFPVCIAGALLALLAVMRFELLRFIPPPYNLVGVGAVPVVVYSALWIWL